MRGANFYWVGIAHSVVLGSGWEPTPWSVVQAGEWEALNAECNDPVRGSSASGFRVRV
jgi:hypothetical protein